MYQETLSKPLPDIDDRKRGILLSIYLMLNLYGSLAQTGLGFWNFLSNLLNYPTNLISLFALAVSSFYLASVIGMLSWRRWAYFSYIFVISIAAFASLFIGQPGLFAFQLIQLVVFLALSFRKFNLFD